MKNSKNIQCSKNVCAFDYFLPKQKTLFICKDTKHHEKISHTRLTSQPLSFRWADTFDCIQFPEIFTCSKADKTSIITYTEISSGEKDNDEGDINPLWSTHDAANLDIYPPIIFFLNFSSLLIPIFSLFFNNSHKFSSFSSQNSSIIFVNPHFKSLYS